MRLVKGAFVSLTQLSLEEPAGSERVKTVIPAMASTPDKSLFGPGQLSCINWSIYTIIVTYRIADPWQFMVSSEMLSPCFSFLGHTPQCSSSLVCLISYCLDVSLDAHKSGNDLYHEMRWSEFFPYFQSSQCPQHCGNNMAICSRAVLKAARVSGLMPVFRCER